MPEQNQFPRDDSTILFSAAASEWLIETELKKSNIHLTEISLVGGNFLGTTDRMLRVGVKERGSASPHNIRLVDEHGCKFLSRVGGSGFFGFLEIPYHAKELRLEFFDPEDTEWDSKTKQPQTKREKIWAAFRLRNLLKVQPRVWTPEPMPVRRDLDIVTVELLGIDREAREPNSDLLRHGDMNDRYAAGQYDARQNRSWAVSSGKKQFRFLEKGRETKAWHKESVTFVDRWGNKGWSFDSFCKEEEIFKIEATFLRDPKKAYFYPSEKWEIPVPRVPDAGEVIPLSDRREMEGIEIELLAITGSGDFIYKDGKIVDAQPEPTEVNFPDHMMPGRLEPFAESLEAKVRVKKMYSNNRLVGDGTRKNTPEKVVSMVPHLAARIIQRNPETMFHLKEQESQAKYVYTGMWISYIGVSNSSQKYRNLEYAVQYFPLPWEPGDRNKVVTFLAQRLRKAEFIVRVPKESRAA
jgi:hypothetical protein